MTDANPVAAGGDGSGVYYRHSGKAPLVALIAAIVAVLAVAFLAAGIYSAGVIYIPFIKLRWLLILGYGIAVGAVGVWLPYKFRIRSDAMVLAVLLIACVGGFYFSWVTWLWILCVRDGLHVVLWRMLIHPLLIERLAVAISSNGTWTLNSTGSTGEAQNVSGAFLWFIWLTEAVTLIAAPLKLGWPNRPRELFCEGCRRWSGKPRKLGYSEAQDPIELRTKLEAGEFGSVGPLLQREPISSRFLSFEHYTCPNCGELNALSVRQILITTNKKKQERKKKTVVIDRLLLHPGEADQLLPPTAGSGPVV